MSSSGPPPEKKRKSDGGLPVVPSWRDRSIERFGLQAVPSGWSKSVAVGSDGAWRRYYKYRAAREDEDARKKSDEDRYDSDGNSIPSDDDEDDLDKEAMEDIVFSWAEYGMERLVKSMAKGCTWQWTPRPPNVSWEDPGKPRSVDYYAHVWSPYAIPHAIKLSHSWYSKVGWDYSDLSVDYSYMLLDFEDKDDDPSTKYEELCSYNNDVIKTSCLNKTTCGKLRKFLYGANTIASKKVTCSDRDFWFLLIGSMGSTDKDLMEDAKDCSLGYAWCPWKEEGMKEKLIEEKAPANDDPNGEPPVPGGKYNPRWCSWLRYRILEVTDSLGPISKHYKPPPAKKASAREESDDDSGRDFGYGYGSDDYGDY